MLSRWHRVPDPSQPGGDAGLSMVEVLVSIVIASILGAMVTLYLLSTLQATRAADSRNELSASGRAGINSMALLAALAVSTDGSSAPDTQRFFSIDQTSAMFCAALDTKADHPDGDADDPVGVRLAVEGGQLIEHRWTDCDRMQTIPPGASDVRRVLAPDAARLGDEWLVTPLGSADVEVNALVDGAALGTSLVNDGSASASDLTSTVAVRIAFQIEPGVDDPLPAPAFSTVVALDVG